MDLKKLIKLVKQHECLYVKYDKDFKNAEKKTATWKQISREMDTTESECIRRWLNLRDKFARESRRMTALSNNDMTTTQIWHLYDDMDFLRPHIIPRVYRQTVNIGLKAFEETSNGEQETYMVEQDNTVDSEFVNTEAFQFKSSSSPMSEQEMEHEDVEFYLPNDSQSATPHTNKQNTGKTSELKNYQANLSTSANQRINKKPYLPNVETELCSALEMFKQICGEIKTRNQNPAVQGFGQMIVETISSMSERKQALAMLKVTEIVMKIKMDESDQI